MSKAYVVIISADVDADDPRDAWEQVVERADQLPARVWEVPENLDEDPQMTYFNRKDTP